MAKDGRDWVRLQDAGAPATMPAERRRRNGSGRKLVLVGGAVLGAGVIAAVGLWFAFDAGEEDVAGGLPPLVAADTSPTKHRPEDPGGMEVPNQQMLVYERVSPNPAAPRAERLLPPPEQPIARPAPPPLPAAPQSAAAPNGEDAAPMADPGAAPGAAPVTFPPTLPDFAAGDATLGATADEPPADTAASAPSAEPAPAPPEVNVVEEAAADDGAATAAAADTPVPAQKPAMAVLAARAVATAAPAEAPPPAPRQTAALPVVTAAAAGASGFRIQLASFSNEAGAQAAWKKLASAHDGVLGKLKPVVVRVDLGQGVRYRLQAGSFADEEDARRACGELKARKQDCLVVSES